jgi:light-regulated signal transduction histidine kinase (bacteriophytochrome)
VEAWLIAIGALAALVVVSVMAFRARGTLARIETAAAIARHIVEQHGGWIWVVSTEGAGSIFSSSSPVAADAA